MTTCRWLALSALALSVSCAKSDREAAPAAKAPSAKTPPAAQPPAEPVPTANAEAPPSPDVPGTPSEGDGLAKSKERRSRSLGPSSLNDEPKTIAEAETRLADAEDEIQQLLHVNKGGAAASPLSTGDGRCEQACKAFASLKRAADAVCRLAGDSHERCTRARSVVKKNEGRVQPCSCSSDDD